MADILAKKISELDTLPNGNLSGYFTIGAKGGASYKVDLSVLMSAIASANAAVSSANNAVSAAQAAQAAFRAAIVQSTGTGTATTMSQNAVTQLYQDLLAMITDLTGLVGNNLDAIRDINGKIPTQATSQNQLADKAFVNSSIASQTANLITYNGGPFPSVEELQRVTNASNNDYAYVEVESEGGTYYDRYKYNGSIWEFEYRLNSTVFTAAQWAAVNSGITAELVVALGNLLNGTYAISTAEINEICV